VKVRVDIARMRNRGVAEWIARTNVDPHGGTILRRMADEATLRQHSASLAQAVSVTRPSRDGDTVPGLDGA